MTIVSARRELLKDFCFIIIGAVIALLLTQIGVLQWFIGLLGGSIITSFVSGIFFTSAFTIAPSAIVLSQIGHNMSPHVVAIVGALGATCGDLLLFTFIRDRFAKDLMNSLRPSIVKKILHSLHLGFLKWLSPLLGALIIASPLPDELGLTLLGLSKTRILVLIPISFIMNTLGIYVIIMFANSI